MEAGKTWYAVYGRNVVQRAREAGLTPEQGLALFAIRSQQASIARNWGNYCRAIATRDPDRIRDREEAV
jgi:hypothetical protein